MEIDFGKIANSIGAAINTIGNYSANAVAKANNISAQAQSAQGLFNQESANTANIIDNGRMNQQFGYNTAMMNAANEYNTQAWERAAQWNEAMWQKQADFNSAEAQKQRDWQEAMSNTAYQRAMNDMEKAGLNPILAYSQGGAGVPNGATATVGGAQMSSAQANMASGGLLSAHQASEGNYTGTMEQMSTTLALLGAIFSGISSAADASGLIGDEGGEIMQIVADQVADAKTAVDYGYEAGKDFKNWMSDNLKKVGKWLTNDEGKKEHHVNEGSYDNLKRNYNRLENDKRIKTHNQKPKG